MSAPSVTPPVTGLRCLLYLPIAAGAVAGAAAILWPDHLAAIAVSGLCAAIALSTRRLLRLRREPGFARQAEAEIARARQGRVYGPLGRALWGALAALFATGAASCAWMLRQSPDLGILLLPLMLGAAGVAIAFAAIAIAGNDRAATGLLP